MLHIRSVVIVTSKLWRQLNTECIKLSLNDYSRRHEISKNVYNANIRTNNDIITNLPKKKLREIK